MSHTSHQLCQYRIRNSYRLLCHLVQHSPEKQVKPESSVCPHFKTSLHRQKQTKTIPLLNMSVRRHLPSVMGTVLTAADGSSAAYLRTVQIEHMRSDKRVGSHPSSAFYFQKKRVHTPTCLVRSVPLTISCSTERKLL